MTWLWVASGFASSKAAVSRRKAAVKLASGCALSLFVKLRAILWPEAFYQAFVIASGVWVASGFLLLMLFTTRITTRITTQVRYTTTN